LLPWVLLGLVAWWIWKRPNRQIGNNPIAPSRQSPTPTLKSARFLRAPLPCVAKKCAKISFGRTKCFNLLRSLPDKQSQGLKCDEVGFDSALTVVRRSPALTPGFPIAEIISEFGRTDFVVPDSLDPRADKRMWHSHTRMFHRMRMSTLGVFSSERGLVPVDLGGDFSILVFRKQSARLMAAHEHRRAHRRRPLPQNQRAARFWLREDSAAGCSL